MILIFVQSALPADLSQQESNVIVQVLAYFWNIDAEILSFAVRKCAHFTEYLILGVSLAVTVREYWPTEERQCGSRTADPEILKTVPVIKNDDSFKTALLSWGTGALYALTDEVHQYFVPGRSCEIRDMLIDSCGVASGVLIMTVILYLRCKRPGPR